MHLIATQHPQFPLPYAMTVFLLLLVLASSASWTDGKCDFPAIFNFGDSNSDTGAYAAAFPPGPPPPFGMTYFKRPAGRGSDGRDVIDFLAQGVGLPFLSPYLQSSGSNFAHGANYAVGGSTVLPPNPSLLVVSPFFLAIQLNQMKALRTRVLETKPQPDANIPLSWDFEDKKFLVLESQKMLYLKPREHAADLPPKDIFGRALYIFDIGQNDFTSNVADFESLKQILPRVASQIAETIKEIYEFGGRTFMVFNLGPVGCYPLLLTKVPHNISDLDTYGCLSSISGAVVDYNKMLEDTLRQTRDELPGASITYADTHSVKLELIQHPKNHGFIYGIKACCGYGGGDYNFDPEVYCGYSKEIDGVNITATACDDPQHYVNWDGIHFTEAANEIVASSVLSGSHFDPPFPLSTYCDLK